MTPTANLGYQSFYQAQLTAGISAADLTIPLDVVPTPSEGFLVLESTSSTKREIIYYTSKTSVSVVCPAGGRGYDGTTAQTHLQNSAVIMAPVAAMFDSMRDLFETTPQGWTPVTQTVSSVSYSGNRSYTLTMSADVSATLSPGMRVKTTRTVTAPTQCTSLNGSSQYYSRASASMAGMTFNDTFTLAAWVKLTSYGSSVITIIRRGSSSQGFALDINADGTIRCYGTLSAGNYRGKTSYQSIPINKWVHVAASYTMSTSTGNIYIDGVDVPVSANPTSGTAATLTNSGIFAIGAEPTTPGSYFTGKIAQAAVFSAVLSAATIRSYYSQGLAGTETSLVSAYSFNGVITDLNTTNANNLTAQALAVATNADSPFGQDSNGVTAGTTDYALVMKVATTTVTVQVPEGCTIPTSGGVSSAAYSVQGNPYGWVSDKDRWAVEALIGAQATQSSSVAGTWYNISSYQLTIPAGTWATSYLVNAGVIKTQSTVGPGTEIRATLSTANNTTGDLRLVSFIRIRPVHSAVFASFEVSATMTKSKGLALSSATPYYLNLMQNDSGGTVDLYVAYGGINYGLSAITALPSNL